MNKPAPFINSNAEIGEGTIIEPFSTVYEDVAIGENTWIGSNVTIFPGTRIGKNCKVFPGAVIGAEPQDLKYKGEYTTVEIGDGTSIRECVTIHRATSDKWVTKVGKNCLLMAYSHIAHDAWIGDHCVLANQASIAGHVEIQDWVTLGGMTIVQQFITIGTHSFVTATSLVRKNVPPYIKVARTPVSYVGVNSIGLKRRNFSVEDIRSIEDIYRCIFVHNRNLTKGMEQVITELKDSDFKQKIVDFIKKSPKGIVRGAY